MKIAKQGLAMASRDMGDLDLLDCSWYYHWGSYPAYLKDSRYVPMSREGFDPNLPENYSGYLLVFNEPNVQEPYGADIHPDVGAERYRQLCAKYKNARMIVGGVTAWACDWVDKFTELTQDCPQPSGYHIHGYIQEKLTYEDLIGFWDYFMNRYHNIWVTETSDVRGRPEYLSKLLTWLRNDKRVDRYAVFTNRATGTESWWPNGWKTQLVDQNGNLTDMGKVMRVYQTYLPIVMKT